MQAVPVIALTGYLGAGKTTMLNHVLRTPDARIGVVINDFGELNVDAGLVTGQVDEPASIAGGCICCLSDDDTLDDALTKLADPKLDLDAIIVEASGMADPVAISRIIRFSGAENVRWGGVVDVIDATRTSTPSTTAASARAIRRRFAGRGQQGRPDPRCRTRRHAGADRDPGAPMQSGCTDRRGDRRADRPHTPLRRIGPQRGPGQLSFRELMLDAAGAPAHAEDPDHLHADSVTVPAMAASIPMRCRPARKSTIRGVPAQRGCRRPLPRQQSELCRQSRGYLDSRGGRTRRHCGQPSRRDWHPPRHRRGACAGSHRLATPYRYRVRPRDPASSAVPTAQHLPTATSRRPFPPGR